MAAISMSRIIVLFLALFATGGVALVFAIPDADHRKPPVEAGAAATEPAASKPASPGPEKPAALAAVQAQTDAVATALGGPPSTPDRDDGAPSFDIARIEPSGEAVIAGRATPGATVELLRNGEVHDRAVADQSGEFAFVPPQLPPGTYELTLRSKRPDGKLATSRQSVAVAIEAKSSASPVVALMTPDKPTVVLSQPAAPKPPGATIAVEAVEIEPTGKFHVSGRARPGAAVRFYLNDTFVAAVTAAGDGRLAVTINEGVSPGSYRVRLDEVDPASGSVRARAEVPFNVPNTVVAAASAPAHSAAPARPQASAAPAMTATPAPAETTEPAQGKVGQPAQPSASEANRVATPRQAEAASQPSPPKLASAAAVQVEGPPSTVVVPKITTTTVSRGDSLWRISRLTYGAGIRYAVIYEANRQQIRDPDLIYPGQIFVLPTGQPEAQR